MFTFLFIYTIVYDKALWCTAQFNISKCNIKKGYTMYLLEYIMANYSVNRLVSLRPVVLKTTTLKSEQTTSSS